MSSSSISSVPAASIFSSATTPETTSSTATSATPAATTSTQDAAVPHVAQSALSYVVESLQAIVKNENEARFREKLQVVLSQQFGQALSEALSPNPFQIPSSIPNQPGLSEFLQNVHILKLSTMMHVYMSSSNSPTGQVLIPAMHYANQIACDLARPDSYIRESLPVDRASPAIRSLCQGALAVCSAVNKALPELQNGVETVISTMTELEHSGPSVIGAFAHALMRPRQQDEPPAVSTSTSNNTETQAPLQKRKLEKEEIKEKSDVQPKDTQQPLKRRKDKK